MQPYNFQILPSISWYHHQCSLLIFEELEPVSVCTLIVPECFNQFSDFFTWRANIHAYIFASEQVDLQK